MIAGNLIISNAVAAEIISPASTYSRLSIIYETDPHPIHTEAIGTHRTFSSEVIKTSIIKEPSLNIWIILYCLF